MIRWPKIIIFLAVASGCVLGLSWVLSTQSHGHIIFADNAATDLHQMNAEKLEREVRISLPVGSTLTTVQEFLTKNGVEFSFEAHSKTVFAIVRGIQGSTRTASKSLAFKFHFDDRLMLKSVDSDVLYTGP